MYITFQDVTGNDITLSQDAIWGITLPCSPLPNPDGPPQPIVGEVLLNGLNKSVKVMPDVARKIKALFNPSYA